MPGLLSYVDGAGQEQFLGVDEGVLVKRGAEVMVSVLGAFRATDLAHLRSEVQRQFLTLLYLRFAKLAPSPAPARADGGVVEIER